MELQEVVYAALPQDKATAELILAALRPIVSRATERAYQAGFDEGRAHARSCWLGEGGDD